MSELVSPVRAAGKGQKRARLHCSDVLKLLVGAFGILDQHPAAHANAHNADEDGARGADA